MTDPSHLAADHVQLVKNPAESAPLSRAMPAASACPRGWPNRRPSS
ncbi:hypothetical protein [Streptomyces sp. STR69]|nr:hypothetical protein [Streptomyces sp. STR69]